MIDSVFFNRRGDAIRQVTYAQGKITLEYVHSYKYDDQWGMIEKKMGKLDLGN